MSKLAFELKRLDVKVKGNYFVLVQLDETDSSSQMTKTTKFRTEIDHLTEYPTFQKHYFEFEKISLENKLVIRIGLFNVINPKNIYIINKKTKQKELDTKQLFLNSKLIGNSDVLLDQTWIDNLRENKYVDSSAKLMHPDKNNEENGNVFFRVIVRAQTLETKISEDNLEIEKVYYDPFEKDKDVISRKLKAIIILNEEKQMKLEKMQKQYDEMNNNMKYCIRDKEQVNQLLKKVNEENEILRKKIAKIQCYDEIDIEIDLLSQSSQGVEILEKKYAILLGQLSIQQNLKYEHEKEYETIKTVVSKIKLIQDRYNKLKEANDELKFNYKVHHDMLPLLTTYEEKIRANNKILTNFRDNIMEVIELRKKNSSLSNEELEEKIMKYIKEREILQNKKLQLNLYADIYIKNKNKSNVTYDEISQPFYRIIGTDPIMNKIKDESENDLINYNNKTIDEMNCTIKDLSKKLSDFEESEKKKKESGIVIEPSLILKRNNLKVKYEEIHKRELNLQQEFDKNKNAFLNAKEVLKDKIVHLDTIINQELKVARMRQYQQDLNALNNQYFYGGY